MLTKPRLILRNSKVLQLVGRRVPLFKHLQPSMTGGKVDDDVVYGPVMDGRHAHELDIQLIETEDVVDETRERFIQAVDR